MMDLLTRIEASLEFMNDGGPIRVDFVNLREVLEGSREALLKLDRCEELLATAYQLAGLVGAPERFLDAYSRQEGDIDSLLPVELSELDEFKELSSRLDSAENAMREVVSHLQHSQRGSTHWAGCLDVHPVCQAIDM